MEPTNITIKPESKNHLQEEYNSTEQVYLLQKYYTALYQIIYSTFFYLSIKYD